MDPRNMSFEEIMNFSFQENAQRDESSSLVHLSLDEAIPILKGQGKLKNLNRSSKKRPYGRTQGQKAPVKKIRLRDIDAWTNSLDDIIEEVEEDGDDGDASAMISPLKRSTVSLEAEQAKQSSSSGQAANVTETGTGSEILEYPEYTPYRAVGYLARKGMPIEILVGQLKTFEFVRNRSHKWRCIIVSGSLKAMADSSRKQVAREMAAVEFLEQLAKMGKSSIIPDYTTLPEVFIDPHVFHMLEKAAITRCLETAHYVKVRPVKKPRRKQGGGEGGEDVDYLFVATFFVGKAAYKGESFVEEYAKLLAAKRAYEGLTGKVVAPITYSTGDLCDPTLEYDFGERENSQSMTCLSSEKRHWNPFRPYEGTSNVTGGSGKPMRKKARLDRTDNFKEFKPVGKEGGHRRPSVIVKREP